MKKQFWILMAALLPLAVSAQKNIVVYDTVQAFSKGGNSCYLVEIPEAKLKEVDKDWTNHLKNISKEKPKLTNGELAAKAVAFRNISPNPFNVYSKLLETQDGVRLTAWFTPDDKMFYSRQDADQDIAIKKFVRDFAVAEYKKVVQDQVTAEQTKLNKLQNTYEDLVKAEEKAVKKINENKRDIGRNEDDLKRNEGDHKLKSDIRDKQKMTVENAKKANNAEVLKAEEEQLKKDENELKKVERENENLHRQIDNWNRQIREAERDIEQAKKDQKLTSDQIDDQKREVKKLENKLNDIK